MNQTFLQKLQRVKGEDILSIFLFLLALPVSFFYKRKRKHMWLICDSKKEARDNGYWFFEYLRREHTEVDCVYAIDTTSPDFDRVKDLGEVVHWGSFRHWLYYLVAEMNISSQKEGKPNAAVCYVLEVYGIRKNARVFLQHGVTKDDMEFLYYKNTKMRMFVCETKKEYDYICERFGYPKGWVVQPGFTRFDHLVDTSSGKKQLLIMPTWRNWIGKPTYKSKEFDDITDFTETEYYKYWNGLLSSPEFLRMIEEEKMNVVFYPHRQMQRFLDKFHLSHPNITVAKWPEYDVQELLKESSVLITDYSSIAMDFAYMKKPLVYFQFDYEKFRQGQYAQGYFSYKEDGFGPVVSSVEEVCASLEKLSQSKYAMEDVYRRRSEAFFDLCDQENCRRTYEEILKIIE